VTRRATVLAALTAAAIAVGAVLLLVRSRTDEPAPAPEERRASELTLLVVPTDAGPLAAVVGAGGTVPPAIVLLPGGVALTIPGQGDGSLLEAAGLPARQAATTVANLLGVWVPHHATLEMETVAAVVDRAGGVELEGETRSGADVVAALEKKQGRAIVWQEMLRALFASGVTWEATDLPDSNGPADIAGLLNAAAGASVEVLPTEQVTAGLLSVDPAEIRTLVATAFGAPDREVVPVIVLNGSGEPGIGQRAAERLIPGGFRVVVSENASDFGHETTQVVAASEDLRPAAERVRDLLGVGDVQIAGPASGLADVTVVIGKDFTA
jgi:hypothetical protein